MATGPILVSLAGGVLIGLAASGLRLLTGEVAGVSGIARRAVVGPDRGWRLAFVAGLVLAGLVAGLTSHHGELTQGLDQRPLGQLALAGALVGLGAGVGRGCTSGHGVCGLANLSVRSLAAVLVFMVVAALTVWIVRHGAGR